MGGRIFLSCSRFTGLKVSISSSGAPLRPPNADDSSVSDGKGYTHNRTPGLSTQHALNNVTETANKNQINDLRVLLISRWVVSSVRRGGVWSRGGVLLVTRMHGWIIVAEGWGLLFGRNSGGRSRDI